MGTSSERSMKILPMAILLCITLILVPTFCLLFGSELDRSTLQVLKTLIIMASVIALSCFTLSELTGNYSQVDKIWSLAPIGYAWTVAWLDGFSIRLILMACLVTVWGIRLSWNFWLKGGYQWKFWEGEEDYRWQVVRAKPEFQSRWKWVLFNLGFISFYQNALIFLFTLPVVVAFQFRETPLGGLDYVATGCVIFFIVFESVADWQQWQFHLLKRQRAEEGVQTVGNEVAVDRLVTKGFLDRGLWSISRHPNYFAEQSIWFCFYLFSIAASGQWINWSVAGCLLLIVLFAGSSNLSEDISSSKYPEYADYQKRVSRFIPWFRSN